MAPTRSRTMSSSNAPPPRLMVLGATGKQGGALIDALVAKESHGFDIYAVTRDGYSEGAKKLEVKPDVRVIEGNFDDPDAIFEQADNLWGIFIVTTPLGKGGAAKEEEQGKAMVKAALKAGIKHIVYTSVDRGRNSDTDPTNIPHFASKKNVEDYIKENTEGTATSWTFLRPVAFMDNMTNDFMGQVFVTMWNQNGMDTKLQLVGTKDIGRVAAEAFLHATEAEYKNKSISLAGDDVSPNEAAKAFKEVTGQNIPYTYGIVGTAVKWMMADELGKMFAWFKSTGYDADVGALKKKYPSMRSFKQWLEEESPWRKTTSATTTDETDE